MDVQYFGIIESEIPRDIIQQCSNCLCIPASILFILRCYNPKINLFQESLYSNGMNFGKAQDLKIPGFHIECKGFSLEENSNSRIDQFDNWKKYVICQLNQKMPVAVCFRNPNNTVHCKVIFQFYNDNFKIFNPCTFNISNSIALNKVKCTKVCNLCNSDRIGVEYYSAIETYSLEKAFVDLEMNTLQMQVLSISQSQHSY